ncbi:MAG: hypothetical protein AW10_01705 [Candidatus Accumulibacter appositus]|uniref:Uncharacterized protein n=1 Tax=Candidatus Accumulibacter appositus TaxID=1454003 RepID=A0A011PU68_9PROT|nr:hypothetical protein [Accumulibacter sp.]EXI80562.1 MAG: hypothetical protein AW10_01705 [Candidatus Accumulibacter appositus]HRF03654.1 hypothetical protein [Accumulibacter sp.]
MTKTRHRHPSSRPPRFLSLVDGVADKVEAVSGGSMSAMTLRTVAALAVGLEQMKPFRRGVEDDL